MRIHSMLFLSFVLALLLCGAPGSVHAQGTEMWPPTPPIASIDGIRVDEHRVHATVNEQVAEVVVTQVFRNESNRLAEGTFLFPLPEDAAVGDFQMTVDGHVLEGQLMDSDTAREIYQETVRQIRDPALLEYAGRGLYRTSVFPVPSGEKRTLQFRYNVLLQSENGLYRLVYPLRVPAASQPARRTVVDVELTAADGLRAIYSPSHDVQVNRTGDGTATVHFEVEGDPIRSDFQLFYGLSGEDVAVSLISNRPAGEDGYFVLLVTPSVEVASDEIVPRNVVFVLDVSGSMEGPKLAQAKGAVANVVERLNPEDRFNLIAFSTGARLWRESLSSVNAENVADALAWIEELSASGSTDINRALLEALAQIAAGQGAAGAPSYVLFMTDGLPTQGETDVAKILRNADANRSEGASMRLFTFGVGFDVNTDLLDTLSQDMGGRSRYVRPDEKIDEAVGDFYATIQTPVLTNVALSFSDGVTASDLYPYPIPDLFSGEQLVLTGRYRQGGETTVTVGGTVRGTAVRYVYPGQSLVNAGGQPFVARLWATRKIGELMKQIRTSGPEPELVDAVVDLSMRYGIVTPYTSYLVQEPDSVRQAQAGPMPTQATQRQSLQDFARQSVGAAAEEEAAAPASGAAAVNASIARDEVMTAESVEEHEEVRFAGGKTFIDGGRVAISGGGEATLWIDTAYSEGMATETVVFGSDRYFELAEDPNVAEIMSLSIEVLFAVDDANAVRVTAEGAPVDSEQGRSAPKEDVGTSPGEVEESFWLRLWKTLRPAASE